MQRRLRDRVRMLIFFTPWVTVPLALLGVAITVTTPLIDFTSLGWICLPVEIGAAVVLALWLRPRYRLSILDSSPLGVFTLLQRRS
ncbi:MAG TPA: hypothetical protein VLV28_03855 [Gaiellaceae bacterium]|nr:hypothetical protein [Gaiellaceae bacterium]